MRYTKPSLKIEKFTLSAALLAEELSSPGGSSGGFTPADDSNLPGGSGGFGYEVWQDAFDQILG